MQYQKEQEILQLYSTSIKNLADEVIKLREAIRYHRDQKGDNRCWLDDEKLYEVLPEYIPADTELPSRDVFLSNCAKFYECRQKTKYISVDDLYMDWDKDKPYE